MNTDDFEDLSPEMIAESDALDQGFEPVPLTKPAQQYEDVYGVMRWSDDNSRVGCGRR